MFTLATIALSNHGVAMLEGICCEGKIIDLSDVCLLWHIYDS